MRSEPEEAEDGETERERGRKREGRRWREEQRGAPEHRQVKEGNAEPRGMLRRVK